MSNYVQCPVSGFCCRTGRPIAKGDLVEYVPGLGLVLAPAGAVATTAPTFKVGQRVLFGRRHGEQTLGEVVAVNRVKLKVRQLESRGTMRTHPIGTIWTVPPTLCTAAPAEVSSAVTPAPALPAAKPPVRRRRGMTEAQWEAKYS